MNSPVRIPLGTSPEAAETQKQSEIARIRAACVENAEELLNAASVVAKQPGSNHIAYHLAALALEEIGKSSMIFMNSLKAPGEEERKRPIDWIEDHERKLFWAVWFWRMDGTNPTKSIQQAFDIARHIHQTRLATLYVEPGDPDARKQIMDADVQNLLTLADAQLHLEKAKRPRELSDEDKADLDWFFAATADPYLKTIVFSKGSFEKQAEFGEDTIRWVRWLKGIIDENNRANIELANKEINRNPPEGEEGRHEDKYEMTIRLRSWSHSIRQKPLTEWNKGVDKIKLHKGGGHSELLVKFILPKSITVQQVWPAGMDNSLLLVTAINIGTVGFFWWYVPEFVSTYTDNVMDLENKAKMALERAPALRVSWGNETLTSGNLTQVSIVFSHIASLRDEAQFAPYRRYWKTLALMAKNDIFFQFEGNLLGEFQLVLSEAMASYGDWDGNEDNYLAAVEKMMGGFKAGSDFVKEIHDLIGVAKMTIKGENKTRPISLDDVIKLKAACDLYLIMKARIEMKKKVDALKAQQATAETILLGEAETNQA